MGRLQRAMVYGKAGGAALGLLLGLFLTGSFLLALMLAAIGAALGHFAIDAAPEAPERPPEPAEPRPAPTRAPAPARTSESLADIQRLATEATDRQRLVDAVCPLMVELARVDTAASQPEVRVMREYFQHEHGFDESGLELVRSALKRLLGQPAKELDEPLALTRAELKPAAREPLVRWLYDLALIDGALTNTERQLLKRLVDGLNLSDEQLQRITAHLFGQGDAHYVTLGLTSAASDDEVKSAFRRLAAEHHPDRFASAPADEAAHASERFREIKEAYDALKQLRGF